MITALSAIALIAFGIVIGMWMESQYHDPEELDHLGDGR